MKKVIKYNKDIFINNVKCMIKYGDEPEIDIYLKNGKRYFIIVYQDFVDYYDENNNYRKLNTIEDIFNYINFDEIIEIDDGGIDYSKDVKDQSIIVDNKIWYNAYKKKSGLVWIGLILGIMGLTFGLIILLS